MSMHIYNAFKNAGGRQVSCIIYIVSPRMDLVA